MAISAVLILAVALVLFLRWTFKNIDEDMRHY